METYIKTWIQLRDDAKVLGSGKIAGTHELYCSFPETVDINGEFNNIWNSATLTIGWWETHGKKTRIPKTRSICKFIVDEANGKWLVPTLLALVKALDEGLIIEGKFGMKELRSFSKNAGIIDD